MADGSKIEWTDATWNPITGCSVVSPGCANCYAMRLAGTRMKHHPSRAGLTNDSRAGPVWNGKVRLNEQWLDQPLRWKKPRMIFVCAHGDLFHENVPDEWLDRVFAVMALNPQHTFQILTKRSARMREYLTDCGRQLGRQHLLRAAIDKVVPVKSTTAKQRLEAICRVSGAGEKWRPLPNVWLGVSAEDQERADERIPDLLATPAAIRFVSAEPLLGPIDFERILYRRGHYQSGAHHYIDVMRGGFWSPGGPGHRASQDGEPKNHFTNHSDIKDQLIDQVIVGGESGPRARPMRPDWARSIRDQCASTGTAFFFKQWGEFRPPETDGEWRRFRAGDGYNGSLAPNGSFEDKTGNGLIRVGKAAAGHLLDGREYHAFPTPQSEVQT